MGGAGDPFEFGPEAIPTFHIITQAVSPHEAEREVIVRPGDRASSGRSTYTVFDRGRYSLEVTFDRGGVMTELVMKCLYEPTPAQFELLQHYLGTKTALVVRDMAIDGKAIDTHYSIGIDYYALDWQWRKSSMKLRCGSWLHAKS